MYWFSRGGCIIKPVNNVQKNGIPFRADFAVGGSHSVKVGSLRTTCVEGVSTPEPASSKVLLALLEGVFFLGLSALIVAL